MEFTFESGKKLAASFREWLQADVFNLEVLVQMFAIMVLYVSSRFLSKPIINYLNRHDASTTYGERRAKESLKILAVPTVMCILLWIATAAARELQWPGGLIQIVASLLSAWVVISFTAGFVRDEAVAKLIAVAVWGIAALNILGVLEATILFLDRIGFTVGEVRVTVLAVAKTSLIVIVLLWLALTVSRAMERRINRFTHLEPSLQVLFTKLIKISLIVIALFVGLGTLSIDMSALAVFGGAVGLGIGFGLQKVVSNLICGVILLLDRSVKPGDIIALPNKTFGTVNRLEARCVSVLTRDGEEHLIPNEDFITQKVENWSYSNRNVRLKIPVSISYKSDPRKAMEILVKATEGQKRVLADPAPVARLVEFGDSSIRLELRVWIRDPEQGVINIQSDVLLKIWDMFQEQGIEIPYPQRDIHIKSGDVKAIA